MAKTTNILDLNNRLEKVEKENVAQNSYTSLKNKPKINSVTLTGNKSLADIGAAAAADLTTLAGNVGDLTNLTTTAKTDTVAAINEVDGDIGDLTTLTTTAKTSAVAAINEVDGVIKAGNIIDQTPNTTIANIGTGKIPAFHDSVNYRVWVPFPFITKNSNYTITLNGASQDNVGDVLSSATIGNKYRTGFELSVAGTYDYKKCGVGLNYSITFA